MSIARMSLRRRLTRRARLTAALTGLLAAAILWAPGTATAADRSAEAPSATLSPGDPIYSGGSRCTLGFNVTDGDDVFILTAGHCTTTGSYWYADPQGTVPIGPSVLSSFPGNDFGLILYENPDLASPGEYHAASPYVGEPVYTVTPQAGVQSGVVTGVNVTVNQGGGNVLYGLIQTNICVEGSLSGAPLLHDDRALGIGSTASGTCATGGTSFFQPVTETLAATGLTLY